MGNRVKDHQKFEPGTEYRVLKGGSLYLIVHKMIYGEKSKQKIFMSSAESKVKSALRRKN